MKGATCAFLMVLGAFVVLVVAGLEEHEKGKHCWSGSDCKKDECCVVLGEGRKSRCQKLLKEGDACGMMTRLNYYFDDYFIKCPCGKGLECTEGDNWYGNFVGKCTREDEEPNDTDEDTPKEADDKN